MDWLRSLPLVKGTIKKEHMLLHSRIIDTKALLLLSLQEKVNGKFYRIAFIIQYNSNIGTK